MSEASRIWYQSFVDPVAQRPYISRLQALLDAYAAPGTRFEVHGIDPPDRTSVRSRSCAAPARPSATPSRRSAAAVRPSCSGTSRSPG